MSDLGKRDLVQLGVLGEVIGVLSEASVPVWLSGGWGLDFVVGERTREHDDVDLLIFSHDQRAAQQALSARGFARLVTPYPAEHLHFHKDGERLSLTFVEYDERGLLVTPGRWSDWPYVEGALEGPTLRSAEWSAEFSAWPRNLRPRSTLPAIVRVRRSGRRTSPTSSGSRR